MCMYKYIYREKQKDIYGTRRTIKRIDGVSSIENRRISSSEKRRVAGGGGCCFRQSRTVVCFSFDGGENIHRKAGGGSAEAGSTAFDVFFSES
jgi:hypothetical protein